MSTLPEWPNPHDYEYVYNPDSYGNCYPLVGYQYKARADYLAAWQRVALQRLSHYENAAKIAEWERLREFAP